MTVGGWTLTYIRVKGKWVYLYRAVDSSGAPIDFLPSAKRDAGAAEPFLSKALGGENRPAPRVINTDKDAAYPLAIVQLKSEAALEENCCHRPVQYLEQCSGTGSSADQASGPRESAFPLLFKEPGVQSLVTRPFI